MYGLTVTGIVWMSALLGAPVTTIRGPHEVTTNGDDITIRFDPARSAAISEACTEIGHIQVLQMWAVYTDRWSLVRPGQLRARDSWLDATASDAGHVIDTCRQADPVFQEKVNRGETPRTVAQLFDGPNLQAADLGPYDPDTNPTGWAKMSWRFQTYAYCVEGPARGSFYEGVAWTWEVYPPNVKIGDGHGTSTFVSELPVPGEDASVRQALARYLAAGKYPIVCGV